MNDECMTSCVKQTIEDEEYKLKWKAEHPND
jgi:hypothetical protein